MYNIGFGIFFSFLFNSYSVSTGHWIPDLRSAKLLEDTADTVETNQTAVFEDINETGGINGINTTESDILFWTVPKTNDEIEPDSEVQLDTNITSENVNGTSEIVVDDDAPVNDTNSLSSNLFEVVEDDQKHEENINMLSNDVSDYAMDEKIVLQRNNCNLEIALQDTQDLRITIKFGKLENNTSGKCCITLNGHKYSKLGVLVSNIHLYQSEILKVIIAGYGNGYVLKEYYSQAKYQPLLLTETNKVYLVLNYNVSSVSPHEQDSYFDLEVITYHREENHFHHEDSYSGAFFSTNHGMSKLPESHPLFTPYYY